MRLSMVKSNSSVIVQAILSDGVERQRLQSLGIIRGSHIHVATSEYGGPMLIRYKNTQLAIGWQLQNEIEVSLYKEVLL